MKPPQFPKKHQQKPDTTKKECNPRTLRRLPLRSYKLQLTNSKEYNNFFKQRGRLDFWIDKSILTEWKYSGKQKRGGKVIYSDVLIEMILVLSHVYSLPLRQTEGFVSSLLSMSGSSLKVPDYTTLCRRRRELDVSHKLRKWNSKDNIVFAIDASGLKCCGEKNECRINTEKLGEESLYRN